MKMSFEHTKEAFTMSRRTKSVAETAMLLIVVAMLFVYLVWVFNVTLTVSLLTSEIIAIRVGCVAVVVAIWFYYVREMRTVWKADRIGAYS